MHNAGILSDGDAGTNQASGGQVEARLVVFVAGHYHGGGSGDAVGDDAMDDSIVEIAVDEMYTSVGIIHGYLGFVRGPDIKNLVRCPVDAINGGAVE